MKANNSHTYDIKMKFMKDLFRGEKSLEELAFEYKVNLNILNSWKTEAITLLTGFYKNNDHDINIAEYQAETGMQTMLERADKMLIEFEKYDGHNEKVGWDIQKENIKISTIEKSLGTSLKSSRSIFKNSFNDIIYGLNFKCAESLSIKVMDDFPVLIWMSDTSSKCIYFNKSWLEFRGRPIEQEIGDGWAEGVHPEDLENCISTYLKAFNFRLPFTMEYRLLRYDGEYRWIHDIGKPLTDRKGNFAGYIGGCFDITEHKLFEEYLAKIKALSDSARDIMLFLTDDGRIIDVNYAAVSTYGYSRDELLSMTIFDLSGICSQRYQIKPLVEKQMAMALENGILFETVHFHKSGREIPVEVSSKGVTINNETLLVSVIRDISEQKTIQAKLNDSNTKLNILENKLTYVSIHDELTGIFNRSFFEQELKRYDTQAIGALGLVICDIDGLKLINDTLGHTQGDYLLKKSADIISECAGKSGIASRIGGDEFAILLPDSTEENVKYIIDRLKEGIDTHNRINPSLHISISLGYAFRQNTNISIYDLHKEAENAMCAEKLNKSESIQSELIKAFSTVMDEKSYFIKEYSDRMLKHMTLVSAKLGINGLNNTYLRLFAKFHDLGKITIPEHILIKTDKLTVDEMEIIKTHCLRGYRIAKSVRSLTPIADWILKHHERWDGKGYPVGLKGNEIPAACRILSVIDAYDAMVSHRSDPTRSLPHEEAVCELKRGSGTKFDPVVVNIFLHVIKDLDTASNEQ